jgi:Uma2 family endonuclease
MATVDPLITAEQYALMPDNGQPTELVRGRIVTMNMPYPRHGYFCGRISRLLGNYVERNDLGRIMTNDSGIVTERGPDSVRGADVAFFSYTRLPKGPLPKGYFPVVPELIIEILSPSDCWKEVLHKVGEYLAAGVNVVGVLDPDRETLRFSRGDQPPEELTGDEEFTLPDILGDFRVRVREFLEE